MSRDRTNARPGPARALRSLAWSLILLTAACGKEKGTPPPPIQGLRSPDSQESKAKAALTKKILALVLKACPKLAEHTGEHTTVTRQHYTGLHLRRYGWKRGVRLVVWTRRAKLVYDLDGGNWPGIHASSAIAPQYCPTQFLPEADFLEPRTPKSVLRHPRVKVFMAACRSLWADDFRKAGWRVLESSTKLRTADGEQRAKSWKRLGVLRTSLENVERRLQGCLPSFTQSVKSAGGTLDQPDDSRKRRLGSGGR